MSVHSDSRCGDETLSTEQIQINQPLTRRGTPSPSPPTLTPASSTSTLDRESLTGISELMRHYDTDENEADIPVPSVECDMSKSSSHQARTSTFQSKTHEHSSQVNDYDDAILQQTQSMQELSLMSPSPQNRPQQSTPAPSIRISSSAPPDDRIYRTDDLVGHLSNLRLTSLEANPVVSTSESLQSASPSPTRRSRSASRVAIKMHQIEDEPVPPTSFHKPEVQQAHSDARTCISKMVKALSSSNLHLEDASTIQGLYRQALRLHNQEMPSSRVVGMIGDSSVGKSSLINSLLDRENLARASSSGAGCTCVVTEYVYHNREDYAIHIEYFTLDELEIQFQDMLGAYWQSEMPDDCSNGREEVKKAKVAMDTLGMIFEEKLKQYPSVLSSMSIESAAKRMKKWAQKLLPSSEGRESFSTVQQCAERLATLSTEISKSTCNANDATSWFFVKNLRVYLNAHILGKGLILADLPGLRDRNPVRALITDRFVRQCDQIFAVVSIERAATNQSVEEIFKLAKHANLGKIDIVCTKTELIAEDEAVQDWPSEKDKIQRLAAEIAKANSDCDGYQQDIAEIGRNDPRDDKEYFELLSHKAACEKRREEAKFQRQQLVMGLRNAKVSDQLQKTYQISGSAPAIQVFCVSSKLYKDHRRKPVEVAKPFLDLSGIIELRQYCIGIVSDSRFHATKRLVNDDIPAFLGSVELWVKAGARDASAEKRQQTLETVASIEEVLEELEYPNHFVDGLAKALQAEFNNQICAVMKRSSRKWSVFAKATSENWSGWNATTYKAFCHNFGDHQTPSKPYHNWNEKAMALMSSDMKNEWGNFIEYLHQRLNEIDDAVIITFESMVKLARSSKASTALKGGVDRSAVQTLVGILQYRREVMLRDIEERKQECEIEMKDLRANALGAARTALVGQFMEPSYREANLEHGRESGKRRATLITGGFGSESLFSYIRRACRKRFHKLACALEDGMRNLLDEQIMCIKADLKALKSQNAEAESERYPEFRERVIAEMEEAKIKVRGAQRAVDGAR